MTKTILALTLFIFVSFSHSQNQDIATEKLLDSVENYYNYNKIKAFEILKKTNLGDGKKKNLNQIRYYKIKSDLYANTDGYTKDYYDNINQALALSKALNEHALTSELYFNLALGQTELGSLNLAEESINKAEYYANEAEDHEILDYLITLKAQILFYKELYAESIDLLLKNKTTLKKNEDIYVEINLYNMLAENYISLKKTDSVLFYFNKLKEINTTNRASKDKQQFEELKSFYSSSLEYNIAKYIIENDNSELSFVKNVLKKPVFEGDLRLTEQYYTIAVNYYLKTKQLKLHKTYNDSLINHIKQNAIDGSKFMEESTVKLLNSHDTLQKEKQTKFKLIVLSSLLLMVLFLVYWFYKKSLEKRKLEVIEYEEKVSVINTIESDNVKLKANINALKNYIEELKKETHNLALVFDETEIKEHIKILHKKVRLNHPNLFNDEQKHLEIINEINAPFFAKLKQNYPILTDSDRLICYFITMEFKNIEISSFFNSSLRAIESRRYRVSKKLNLSKEESLKEFLEKNS